MYRDDLRGALNLNLWQKSGEPLRWIQSHPGGWGHDDWLRLLASLERSEYWPMDPHAVGMVLEETRRQWWNLGRWQAQQARAWVQDRQGQWNQDDWLGLLASLRHSEFWPLDVEAARDVLQRLTAEYWNLRRWQRSGQPRLWVESRQGRWDHADWLDLLESLGQSQFWPMDPQAVGQVVEEAKRHYGNVQRWQEAGEPLRWAECHSEGWEPRDLQDLVSNLKGSEYWPMDVAVVEAVLEEMPTRHRNLHRWVESGAARAWVHARQGRWSEAHWVGLLATLQRSIYWPLDPNAIGPILRRLNLEWWNLRRWRVSGLARQWVEQHQGQWGPGDFLALVQALQRSQFGPIHPESVRGVLEEIAAAWRKEPQPLPVEAASGARQAG